MEYVKLLCSEEEYTPDFEVGRNVSLGRRHNRR